MRWSPVSDGWNKPPLLLPSPPTKAATSLHSCHREEDTSEQHDERSVHHGGRFERIFMSTFTAQNLLCDCVLEKKIKEEY